MTISLDFEDCIKDSPNFRDMVHQSEVDALELESQIDRMVKHCTVMVDTGKVYNNACKGFIGSIHEVGYGSTDDPFVQETLKRFTQTMSEVTSFHTMLFDQAQRSVKTQLSSFLKNEVKPTRDLKKTFDKVSDDYLSALSKHAGAHKLKQNELDDTNAVLNATRKCFRSVAMDYVFQVGSYMGSTNFIANMFQLLSYMRALFTFFHQGYDLLKDLEPYMKSVSGQVRLKLFHLSLLYRRLVPRILANEFCTLKAVFVKSTIVIEGHLFKRASNAFKTWNRRWFTIKDNKLFYQKKKDDLTVVVDDIRLCTVRMSDETERRFCFEIVLPGKSFLLQAETDGARTAWIKAIQSSIGAAFKDTMDEIQTQKDTKSDNSNPTSFLEDGTGNIITKIYRIPGNKTCADCGKAEPRWASISLGVTLCIECSGVHRSLGVHVSKVRSLTLDQWEPEVVKIMFKLGNNHVNEIYTANATPGDHIKPGCSDDHRMAYIRAKYVDRKFAMSLPKALGPQPAYHGTTGTRLTRWTVSKRRRARPSPNRSPNRSRSPKTIIHIDEVEADDSGSTSCNQGVDNQNVPKDDLIVFGQSAGSDGKEYEETEIFDLEKLHPDLLMYRSAEAANLPVMLLAKCNNAKVNWMNDSDEGKTALMQAAISGSVPACEFLLVNGAKLESFDWKKRTALHYATLHNQTSVACQLLKRKIDLNAVDEDGKTALDIAVDAANADIVTLIRLKKMSDEMKEDNTSTSQTDALVTDVFRDFSHRTYPTLNSPDPSEANRKFNILGATLLSSESPPVPNEVPAGSVGREIVNLSENPADLTDVESSV
uniref:Arf-GAP with coiled-coil, ANK repeat and PH domain-containing protein 2 n=1 Tax=Ciona savignyi TaxID=51511 RepID=H2ZKC2_CIOSA